MERTQVRNFYFETLGVIFSSALMLFLFAPESSLGDVRISNMNNIGLGSWGGSGDVQDEDGVCVFNDSGPGYLITASGSGGGGAFLLNDGADTVDYEVRFRGSSGSFTALGANSPQSFSSADQADSSCSGGTNATLRITVTEAELLAAHSGSYSGTLNIQVDPN